MKGKILSVLFCLMLVFGMIFAACDNGDVPTDPYKDDAKKTALDWQGGGTGNLTTPTHPNP
jgi:hypothetical protein